MQHALRWLLEPIAWAIAPLERRMGPLQPPCTFIYGSRDWMDATGGERACETLRAQDNPRARGVKHAGEVLYVEDAGHHPYLDQTDAFNAVLLDVLAWCMRPEGAATGAGTGGTDAANAAARLSQDHSLRRQTSTLEEIEQGFADV